MNCVMLHTHTYYVEAGVFTVSQRGLTYPLINYPYAQSTKYLLILKPTVIS